MSFTAVVLLACAMSADAFVFGVSFGAKGIKINLHSLIIITLTGLGVLVFASSIGEFINKYMIYGNVAGAYILIGVGMWLCSDSDEEIKSVLDNPAKADMNMSKSIEPLEAMITGIVLSIDSAAVAAGSAMGDNRLSTLPVMVLIFQVVFIMAGLKAGESKIKIIPQKTISILSGFVIVLIGLYKLSAVFG